MFSIETRCSSKSTTFFNTCWVVERESGSPVREQYAMTRVIAPSRSRTLDLMFDATNSETSGGTDTPSASAFLARIAILVSRSGGWRSAVNPQANRDRKRSSRDEISLGAQSLDITTCFWA